GIPGRAAAAVGGCGIQALSPQAVTALVAACPCGANVRPRTDERVRVLSRKDLSALPTDPNPPGPPPLPPPPLPPPGPSALRRAMASLRQRLARLQPPGPAAFATPITGDDPRARAMQAIEERSAVLHAPGPRPPVFGAPAQPEQPHLAALAPPPGLPSD